MNQQGKLIPTTQYDKIPHIANYGTAMVTADNLALQRGSGNFNPGPKYEQTVNRGQDYSQALNYYANFDPNNYYNNDQNLKAENFNRVEKDWKTIQSNFDQDNKKPYVVGTTGMHSERPKSWSRPDYKLSYGTDQYQVWAAKSTHMTPNALMNFFFSTDNVKYLQKQIGVEVKRLRNVDISPQSIDDMLIIMRNKYLYALSGWLPHAGDKNKPYGRGTINNPNGKAYDPNSNGGTSLKVQVTRLNKSVLEECVKQVLGGITAYQKFYQDASSLPMPLSHGVLTTMKGSNVLQENLGFNSGHEMSKSISSYNQKYNII